MKTFLKTAVYIYIYIYIYFLGFLFATAKVASATAMIFFHIILHPAVLIYDFHIFITSKLKVMSTFFLFYIHLIRWFSI